MIAELEGSLQGSAGQKAKVKGKNMSELRYKTKEHFEMMSGLMDKADTLDNQEVWVLIKELREICEIYHDLSLKCARRETRNVNLTEIADRYKTTLDKINSIINEATPVEDPGEDPEATPVEDPVEDPEATT